MDELAILFGTYLLAAVPFGLLLGFAAGGDVRQLGSGNIGATNVLRAHGRWLGVTTLLLDGAKGASGVLVARWLSPELWTPPAAALVAVVAHCYPVYLRFRGGKGVATAAGAFLILSPIGTLYSLVVFGAVLMATRLVSAASLAGTLAMPLIAWLLGLRLAAVAALLVALLIVWRHRENLRRLFRGEEARLGERHEAGGER